MPKQHNNKDFDELVKRSLPSNAYGNSGFKKQTVFSKKSSANSNGNVNKTDDSYCASSNLESQKHAMNEIDVQISKSLNYYRQYSDFKLKPVLHVSTIFESKLFKKIKYEFVKFLNNSKNWIFL